ncbi:SAM-dependent methyltransferase [Salinibacter sp. 10B]|uniref:class I SAM-dependent methyltransferase n=1 Tax=Salinibacter sp. 10B TaxID=1923971 RepID=UPI000CF514AC|nr:class I SAM-dependent methyltransferase [Salinibacter sp. 10B]PQJ34323.1 SAM-dependent methyltransferase [Salinibacter sp. 10B]
MPKPASFWDDRFAADEYVYGVQPNDFIREAAATWLSSPCDVLDLGVGEGRNAVHLARQGHTVTAVDYSAEGLRKTEQLAEREGVSVETLRADVRDWDPDRTWDAVVITFLHLSPSERPDLYALLQHVLRPGGTLIAEWFRPEQRTEGYTSGGPPDVDMMVTVEELRTHFAVDGIEQLERAEPMLDEGMHTGPGATVRFVWRRPA